MMTKSIRLRAIILASLPLFLANCSSSSAGLSPLPNVAATEYRLDAGDELRIFVYGLDAMNNVFAVNDNGILSLPLVENIPARGRTITELEQAIGQELLDRQIVLRPVVNIQAVKLRPFYIAGEVKSPGGYSYQPGMTVFAAAALAGGYTFRANQRVVEITRTVNGQTVKGTAGENDPVLPGDRIRVLEKWF